MKLRVYKVPVLGWQGVFADHAWIAMEDVYGPSGWVICEIKDFMKGDYQVLTYTHEPEKCWQDHCPGTLVHEVELNDVYFRNIMLKLVEYPYRGKYVRYPGPNSNTYVQWILNEYPEIGLGRLPFRCFGRNFLDHK